MLSSLVDEDANLENSDVSPPGFEYVMPRNQSCFIPGQSSSHKDKLKGFGLGDSSCNWNIGGDLKLIDLGCDFYIVRLNSFEDLNHVLTNGPWIIAGHYLTMRRYKLEFQPNKERIKHTAVGFDSLSYQ
ncbi:reverse transcriptase [Quillaja saponaria]|uniref:Reverse transcriptase n=1 Tax=Quillaja saponaria TaxID=32244 RepID=A0AAD7LNX4_QUISA|nr:reverse transcriptase [Quillaja saponaria]